MKSDNALRYIEEALPVQVRSYRLDGQRAGLVIVDEVNGFCTVDFGPLAPSTPDAQIDTMIAETNQLAQKFADQNRPILLFLDTHEPGKPEHPYPLHCEKGSGEEELVTELAWLWEYPSAVQVKKDCINGFIGAVDLRTGENAVLQWLERHKLEVLLVVGICTDICVMDFVVTILSVRNHGMTATLKDVVVYAPGCATYDLSPEQAAEQGLPKTAIHPQKPAHHIGLYTMAERGAFIASEIHI